MEIDEMNISPFTKFHKDWALVTAGDENNYNTMTVSWGSMGTLWNEPIVTVYIKPIRYTYSFLKEQEYFTVSFYGNEYKKSLAILGSKSGKDGDKVAEVGFHPEYLEHGVTFKEAKQTLVCKKIYSSQFVKEEVPEFAHEKYYTDEDEHYMFIGQVVEIR